MNLRQPFTGVAAFSAQRRTRGDKAMYYEDREPNFFDKLWLCLYRYWND
ncbi:MAG: hypothetical protein JO000_19115 [Alphaproteobacteria bacterium]|nr:hypothetical protein [Alphaproteobacteria bacterium]